MFRVSVRDYRAQDSVNYEAIGMAPDEYSKTTKEDLLSGKDLTLENGMELLFQ